MIATQSADTIETRRQEAVERLARQYPQFVAERDDITGGWIVQNERVPGRSELVSIDGRCTCRLGRVFRICKHIAAVETQ